MSDNLRITDERADFDPEVRAHLLFIGLEIRQGAVLIAEMIGIHHATGRPGWRSRPRRATW